MAYGTIYTITYTARKGHTSLLNIDKKSYVGYSSDLICGAEPLVIQQERLTDKYQPVVGSEALIGIKSESDFQYSEFFQVAEDEYRVEFKIDGTLWWRGFMVSDIYQEQYGDPPYDITLRAADGLALLKGIPYTVPSTSRQTIMQTIWDCLDQVDSETDKLPLYDASDVYETTMSQNESDSPFTQAQIDTNGFADEFGDTISCYEVLEQILRPFGCRIFQNEGAWWIVRVNRLDAAFPARKFDDWNDVDLTNSYIDIALGDFDRTISTGTDKYIVGRESILSLIPAYKRVFIDLTLGVPTNLIPDGEFEASAWDSATALAKWTETSINIRRMPGSGEGSVYACRIEDVNTAGLNTGEYIESSPTTVSAGGGGNTNQIRFRFKYKVTATGVSGFFDGWFEVRIEPAAGGNPYYWQPNTYTWVQEASPGTQITWQHASTDINSWKDFIASDANGEYFDVPVDGELYVRFYTPNMDASWTWQGLEIDSVISQLSKEENMPVELEVFKGEVTDGWTFEPPRINTFFGDVSLFAGSDFQAGTFAQLDFDIVFGSAVDGDTITFDVNGTARTYTYKVTPVATRDFDDIDRFVLISCGPDLGTNYNISTTADGGTESVTIIATTHNSTLNFGTVTPTAPTFINVAKVDNVDPSTGNEVGLHRGSITINGQVSALWTRKGLADNEALMKVLIRSIINNHAKPTRSIEGKFIQHTGTLSFAMALDDPNDSSGAIYTSGGLAWYDKHSYWRGKWVEVLDTEKTVTITQSDRPVPGNAGTTTINNNSIINGGASGLVYVFHDITSADILALNTTPFELVAAPSSTKWISVVSAWANFIWNSIAYTGAGNTQIAYNNGALTHYNGVSFGVTNSRIINFNASGNQNNGESQYLGNNLVLFHPTADPTLGNSTARIHILYQILAKS